MPRLRILSATEREAYDRPPAMNTTERRRAFDLPSSLVDLAGMVQDPKQRIGLLVSAAYFGVAKRFFAPRHYRERDVAHAARRLRLPEDAFEAGRYPARARQRHEIAILEAHGMRRFDRTSEAELTVDIDAMVATHLRPKLIFLRCLDLLGQRRVQLPSEHRLTALIASAMAQRKRQLVERVEQLLTPELREVLDGLLAPGDGTHGSGDGPDDTDEGTNSGKRARLTLLKRLTQSTGPKDVRSRVAHLLEVRAVHDRLRDVLPAIGLGREGIAYFAGGVMRARLSQLHQRSDPDRHLHAIAFIAHQYARLQDNLVDTLLTSVQAHLNACRREHKELCYAQRRERDERLVGLVDAVDRTVQGVAERLDALERATTIVHEQGTDDADKLARLRMLLPAADTTAGDCTIDSPGGTPAFGRVIDDVQSSADARSSVGELRRALAGAASGADYNAVLERRSVRLQNKVSPILRVIALHGDEASCDLTRALDHFRERDGAIGAGAPHAFLDPDERRAVVVNGAVARVSLYKALLFAHVARAIKAGTLNLEGSTKYRPLDDYLIDRERWTRERDALIERAGLADLADPARVLAGLDDALHRQYATTNGRIADGANPFFRRSARHRFTVATPATEDDEADAEPLWPLLPGRHVVPLPEVLATVNRHAGFSAECRPWQQTRQHGVGERAIFAAVMGLGCGIGIPRMARIAQGVSEGELERAAGWHLSLDNVQAANDRIVRLSASLDLPEVYRRDPERLHTASDGQKFAVRRASLNANHSFKYFGKGQGVSAYTFIDERQLLWHSLVMSAAERESAYVVDGLMRNDVVRSDIHSTDSHGYAEAIFAVTHLLGISYAPRIKNIGDQTLYGFRSRNGDDRSGWAIAPDKPAREDLVLTRWDDVLRLVATIKLKEATASDIFRRLNSYAKQHELYRALKAFGQIIKTLFVLRYVDEIELRQTIERQLSRVELAHRFTRAVAVGNPREFEQTDKENQEVAESCNRLIKNAIVCWNYLYFEHRLRAIADPAERQALVDTIGRHAMISWRHVNMLGEYDFSDERLRDSFGLRPPAPVA